jgi:23S rRNA-intervening sequence protein
MARFEHLPIYRKAFDLTVYLENAVRQFSRDHRFGLGQDLRAVARRVCLRIMRANASAERWVELRELRLELEELLLLVRLAKEVRRSLGSRRTSTARTS